MSNRAMTLRYQDFSLDPEQQALFDSFGAMLDRECSTEVVRAAEPLGFDEGLWRKFRDAGAVTMGVPTSEGGDGAGLIELCLVAEQCGRHLAPVPFVESTVSSRLLARSDSAEGRAQLSRIIEEGVVTTVAVLSSSDDEAQLIPAGAVADAVVAPYGDELVVARSPKAPELIKNMGTAPLTFQSISSYSERVAVAADERARGLFSEARLEWKLLTAATLMGIGQSALRLAVDYAKERTAFGVPIGSFQGLSHRLANAYAELEAVRMLTRKAAWFADHEPEEAIPLILMAFLTATRASLEAVTATIHVLGGVGFTLESDAQLYFRRVKTWSLAGADLARDLNDISEARFTRGAVPVTAATGAAR
jgi:alkylation response protein AidB-like acyl-CoA dehydrogenase